MAAGRSQVYYRTLKPHAARPHESFDDLMYVSQAYEVGRPGAYFIRAMREIPKEFGKGTVKFEPGRHHRFRIKGRPEGIETEHLTARIVPCFC